MLLQERKGREERVDHLYCRTRNNPFITPSKSKEITLKIKYFFLENVMIFSISCDRQRLNLIRDDR